MHKEIYKYKIKLVITMRNKINKYIMHSKCTITRINQIKM